MPKATQTGDTIKGRNVMPRIHGSRRASAAWLMPNTKAAATAVAVNRRVFHAANRVSSSHNTCHDSPACAACTNTAAKGRAQNNSRTVSAKANSSRLPALSALAGGNGAMRPPPAVPRLNQA